MKKAVKPFVLYTAITVTVLMCIVTANVQTEHKHGKATDKGEAIYVNAAEINVNKRRELCISCGYYTWPCGGWISSYFGYRDIEIGSTYHKGLDIAEYKGAAILASDGGTVTYSGECGDYGNMIEILHDNGEITRYAHCDSLLASVGDKVRQGECIAYMGDTGLATGVHLHFEIIVDGERTDPLEKLVER